MTPICNIQFEPSDSRLYRFIQVIPDLLWAFWSALKDLFSCFGALDLSAREIHSMDIKELETKVNNQIQLTPRELRIITTTNEDQPRLQALNESERMEGLRTTFLNSLDKGIYIFVVSRLTHRAITERRFNFIECIKYTFSSDPKHMGFLINHADGTLTVSHLNQGYFVEAVKDPLPYAQSLLLRFTLPDTDESTQKLFNEKLIEKALILPPMKGMGPQVILPYILGHKSWTSTPPDQIEIAGREMCSSYMAKRILQVFSEMQIDSPVDPYEALHRIDILRFFKLFSNYLTEVPIPEEVTTALPSPTHYLKRFLIASPQ